MKLTEAKLKALILEAIEDEEEFVSESFQEKLIKMFQHDPESALNAVELWAGNIEGAKYPNISEIAPHLIDGDEAIRVGFETPEGEQAFEDWIKSMGYEKSHAITWAPKTYRYQTDILTRTERFYTIKI